MSVQLIVYPQNYEGQYNAFSTSATEALVNGINFTGLNTTTSYDSSGVYTITDTITNEPPVIANTWYRFRSTSAGTPTLPTVTSNNLVLNSTKSTNIPVSLFILVAIHTTNSPITGYSLLKLSFSDSLLILLILLVG